MWALVQAFVHDPGRLRLVFCVGDVGCCLLVFRISRFRLSICGSRRSEQNVKGLRPRTWTNKKVMEVNISVEHFTDLENHAH